MVCIQKPVRELARRRKLVLKKSIWMARRIEIQEQNFDSNVVNEREPLEALEQRRKTP